MSDQRSGWSWFERDSVDTTTETNSDDFPDTGKELRIAYARCFSTDAGQKVLAHMKSFTQERSFGPHTSTEMLRHVEGQRQLVSYIKMQTEYGRRGR